MRPQDPERRRRMLEECREIAARLNDDARDLAMNLLPNGHEENGGRYWRCKNFAGDAGQALCIDISGDTCGQWTNFASCKGASDWSGDMLDLVARVRYGGRKADAIAWARSRLGIDDLDPARLAVEQAKRAERQRTADEAARAKAEKMLRIARGMFVPRAGCAPIVGTPAEAYLAGRCIDLARFEVADRHGELRRYAPGALAFHPRVLCLEAGPDAWLPAMIARVLDGHGEHVATHRTWLAQSGLAQDPAGAWIKAPVPNPKMTLGRYQDAADGGYIPLWKGTCRRTLAEISPDTDVYVSEGIEDGLSVAMIRPANRVIAAVSVSNIGNLVLPEQAGRLVIIGQNDAADSAAASTLENAIARQQDRGREVAIIRPPAEYKDFNDMICGKRMRREAA